MYLTYIVLLIFQIKSKAFRSSIVRRSFTRYSLCSSPSRRRVCRVQLHMGRRQLWLFRIHSRAQGTTDERSRNGRRNNCNARVWKARSRHSSSLDSSASLSVIFDFRFSISIWFLFGDLTQLLLPNQINSHSRFGVLANDTGTRFFDVYPTEAEAIEYGCEWEIQTIVRGDLRDPITRAVISRTPAFPWVATVQKVLAQLNGVELVSTLLVFYFPKKKKKKSRFFSWFHVSYINNAFKLKWST